MRAEGQAHIDRIEAALALVRRSLDWDRAVRRLDELNARVEDPAHYFDVLKPFSSDLEVWDTIYQQVLTGKDPVAQYTSSTGLRPFLEALAEPERAQFYAAYARLIAEAYPTRADGITLFPFRRLFIVGRHA